jgi:hypothetical protein
MVRRKRYKINYSEGDCFVFPLEDGGFARGIVVRMDNTGGLLGYFYGPRLQRQEDACITEDLKPDNTIYVHRCGDLGLVDSEYGWKVIGKIPSWNRADWPMPVFGYVNPDKPDKSEIRIFDENTLEWTHSKIVSAEEAKKLPGIGLGGYGFIERQVSRILLKLEQEQK